MKTYFEQAKKKNAHVIWTYRVVEHKGETERKPSGYWHRVKTENHSQKNDNGNCEWVTSLVVSEALCVVYVCTACVCSGYVCVYCVIDTETTAASA